MDDIKQNIEWKLSENPDIKKIIVIIAGNDIKYGKKYCKVQLEEIMKMNPRPKIYSAIPKYSQNDGDEKDKEEEN